MIGLLLIPFRRTRLWVNVEISLDKLEVYQSPMQLETSPVYNVIKMQILKCQLKGVSIFRWQLKRFKFNNKSARS